MHQALYRKYRPADFSDVYGQEHITSALQYEIENNKVSHAYLFCGSRGTGKTTCAKIFAKAVNCLNPKKGNPCGECEICKAVSNETTVDIVEMDAASNTGVNYIRDIKETVVYPPAMLKTRVFIIDEVHMLSTSAFNALLKTLEEPPERVIFILATTEVHKIPITVLSRCQRFDFKRISTEVITKRLHYIADRENFKLDDNAAKLIARLSNGGMRDAISLLEVCSGNNSEINVERVKSCAGISGRDNIISTVKAIANSDFEAIFNITSEINSSSLDFGVYWQDLIAFYRDMLIVKSTKNAIRHFELSEEEIEEVTTCASLFTLPRILYHTRLLDRAYTEMQNKVCDRRICAEMTLIRMSENKISSDTENLIAKISELEERINLLSSGASTQTNRKAETKKPEPTKTVNKAPAEVPESTSEKPKKFTDWAEVINKYQKTDPCVSAFMQSSSATISGNKLTLFVPDDMTSSFISKEITDCSLQQVLIKINPSYAGLIIEIKVDKDKASEDVFDQINF